MIEFSNVALAKHPAMTLWPWFVFFFVSFFETYGSVKQPIINHLYMILYFSRRGSQRGVDKTGNGNTCAAQWVEWTEGKADCSLAQGIPSGHELLWVADDWKTDWI